MAKEVQAVRAYSPRVVQKGIVEPDRVAEFIEGRTNVTAWDVLQMLFEFKETLTFMCGTGQPVRLRNIGLFSPTINRHGEFSLNFVIDPWLKAELNKVAKEKAKVVNKDMIGKSKDEMVARWNEEHPDNPIETK